MALARADRGPERGGDAGEQPLAQAPMMGRIAAGTGVTAAELPGEVLPPPGLLVGFGDLMMLTEPRVHPDHRR